MASERATALSCALASIANWRRAKVCNTFLPAPYLSGSESGSHCVAAAADRAVVIATSLMQAKAHSHTHTQIG